MQADFGTITRREPSRFADPWLVGSAAVLTIVGILAIHSIDQATGFHNAARQGVFAALGVAVWYLFRRVPLSFWQWSSKGLYVLNILLLAAVLAGGHSAKGAQRWIEVGSIQFQPGDLSKVLLVLTLSAFFAARQDEVKSLKTFFLSFLHVAPLVVLLMLQPHYGGAACMLVIWLAVALYAGVPWQHIGASVACVLALLGVAMVSGSFSDYHKGKLDEFFGKILRGTSDTQGKGWQAAQSVKAIAMGGVTGTGYLRGEQKAGRYIPEQHNDFVFSVIGEEMGLIGSVVVLGVFMVFFYRLWDTGFRCREPMGRLVAGGLLAFLAFHTVVNLAMVLNIGPVIGLWLPFVSNGGTALLTCMASVGLVDQLH